MNLIFNHVAKELGSREDKLAKSVKTQVERQLFFEFFEKENRVFVSSQNNFYRERLHDEYLQFMLNDKEEEFKKLN